MLFKGLSAIIFYLYAVSHAEPPWKWLKSLIAKQAIWVQFLVKSLNFLVIFTGRNEVVAKDMFLLVSVILSTWGGVCFSACWDTTPWEARTPREARTPWQARTPHQALTPASRLRHTINERPVRILLECILVSCSIRLIR